MARTKGTFAITSNYEVSLRRPFDARSLVKVYSDLLDATSWNTDEGKYIAYNGMIVAVANDSESGSKGVYYLYDPDKTSATSKPDVTNFANWHKLAELDDIDLSDIIQRISDLEKAGYVDGDFVASQIAELQKQLSATVEGLSANKTITSLKQENGVVIAESQLISITHDQVSDFAEAVDSLVELSEGEIPGSVRFNDVDVPVKGLQSAAFLSAESFEPQGAVAELERQLVGTIDDPETANTIHAAKLYAKNYTDTEILKAVNNSQHLKKQIVTAVNTDNNTVLIKGQDQYVAAVENVIYLKYDGSDALVDKYFEYTLIDSKLELIGSTGMSLEDYATKADLVPINNKLQGVTTNVADLIDLKISQIPPLAVATADKLGGIKSSSEVNSIIVNDEGVASINSVSITKLVQTAEDVLILDGNDI